MWQTRQGNNKEDALKEPNFLFLSGNAIHPEGGDLSLHAAAASA